MMGNWAFSAMFDWLMLSSMVLSDGVHQILSEENGVDAIYVFFLQVSGVYSSCSHWVLSRVS